LLWKNAGARILLLAPTGRASRRLSDATLHPASTIHRALEWNPSMKSAPKHQKLDADLIVCDEASMLDVMLAEALLCAVKPGSTLVFVGDVDQLPSVGPGRVLSDLIDSEAIPVARLLEVFRQESGSMIIQNAHRILHGQPLCKASETSDGEKIEDFYIIETEDPIKGQDVIVRLCVERIPKRFGLHPLTQVQVLTPMHRAEIGTEALNQRLQQALNPKAIDADNGLVSGTNRFFRDDKVMQIKNDYERDVWNGDVGFVDAIDLKEEHLWVQFDERRVLYKADQLDQLELGYAISVHKSQGSEYPAVIIPIFFQHLPLLKRNLLYTAVTRGRQLVVLIGTKRAIARAMAEQGISARYTHLSSRFGKTQSAST